MREREGNEISLVVAHLQVIGPHLKHPLLPTGLGGRGLGGRSFSGGRLEEGEGQDKLVVGAMQELGPSSGELLP